MDDMKEQFNLVKQLADMQNKAIDKQIRQVTFDLSKKPRQTSNKNK
jgi:hypothetical protein